MENRTRLRVYKPKAFKNGKKHLVKRVFDFLKSDTFFYAPLLSNVPSHFLSPDFLPSPTKVVEFKNPVVENKSLMEEIGEYVKSDVYMYAPMAVAPPPPVKGAETVLSSKKVSKSGQKKEQIRMSVSTRRMSMKVNQPADQLRNANIRSENPLPRSGVTVKRTIYQTCHSNPAPGNVTLNSHLTARC